MLERFIQNGFRSYDDFMRKFEVRIPPSFNFTCDVVDAIADKTPGKRAIVWCDDRGREATFTFGEVKVHTDRTAHYLASLGIRKGDPVMLILKRRYEYWFCALALHKIGAVCIPATHLLTAKDLVYRNNAAGVKMIIAVSDPDVVAHVDEAQKKSPTLQWKVAVGDAVEGWDSYQEGVDKAPDLFPKPSGTEATTNQDTFLLYFTSGTTGMPKMVRHNYTYPLGHLLTARYWQNVQEGGLHFTVADTGWAKAAWGKLYGQWMAGSAVFVYDYDKFVPRQFLEVLTRHGVTSFCAPPTIYRFLVKEDLTQYDFSRLKYATVAGEPLNPEVYNQFLRMTGLRLMEGYGQTEMTLAIGTFPWMDPKPGSMGKPSPEYDVELVHEDGTPCRGRDVGQIVIRTGRRKPVGMFDGYHQDEALTSRVWHDGIYYTGDMAFRDEEGYFWFVGRADDVIKSSGYRIGPFEVESALLEHPAVLECAITGVPDPDRGQVVKASIVLTRDRNASEELIHELQEHVKSVTAPYKYPRIIEFVKELPKTISGKIRRVEIREADQRSPQ
jgi:acetyl-CoA synthetase